jgi:signal transduction histidine kinase
VAVVAAPGAPVVLRRPRWRLSRTQGLTREVTLQDERRRLLGRVLQAAEDERTRIAHDLHDGPVQQLAVLNDDVYRAHKRIGDLPGRVAGESLMQELQGTDEVLEGSGSASPTASPPSWRPSCTGSPRSR